MVLYFLRHAEAEPDADEDFDRKLTDKGLEQAEKAAVYLYKNGLIPDLILTSPVVRAKQTAKLVAKKLDKSKLEEAPWLACGMAVQTCLKELRKHAKVESVMLVGHEPDFSEAISALLGLAKAEAINVRKASLTCLELPAYRCGAGELQFLVPARLM